MVKRLDKIHKIHDNPYNRLCCLDYNMKAKFDAIITGSMLEWCVLLKTGRWEYIHSFKRKQFFVTCVITYIAVAGQ